MLFFLLSSLPFFLILGQSELRLKSFNLVDLFIFSSQPTMATKKLCAPAIEDGEESAAMSFLDLPELTMEIILGKLSPAGLCNMARVCSSMRERCKSDFLWERHMKEKWGGVIGSVAQRNWQCYLASARDSSCGAAGSGRSKNWVESLACFWPLSWLKSRIGGKTRTPLIDDSIMSWYLSLESGKFWFPAQVFNRENGHVGFMLSCYDAELCYDCHTDTFQARYPPHGRRTIVTEEGLQWDRLRVPPLDTSPQDLHVSDCLNDLRPGDHIEIQWRRNKEFPYGWWYGVVGHLESCDGNEHFCRCSVSDTVVLEFNQYASGSRWRRACVSRKDHQEEGNEADGFYGGIRKLHKKDEITTWKRFWQTESSE